MRRQRAAVKRRCKLSCNGSVCASAPVHGPLQTAARVVQSGKVGRHSPGCNCATHSRQRARACRRSYSRRRLRRGFGRACLRPCASRLQLVHRNARAPRSLSPPSTHPYEHATRQESLLDVASSATCGPDAQRRSRRRPAARHLQLAHASSAPNHTNTNGNEHVEQPVNTSLTRRCARNGASR